MQKEFDLIVERLEEKHKESDNCPKFEKVFRQVAFEEAIEIVNQVSEEYEQEVCEWSELKKSHRYMRAKSHNNAELSVKLLGWKYCPYCGKKIKVVE